MVVFSFIVLSKTDNDSIFNMNQDCFNTFVKSVEHINGAFEIILVESNKESEYYYTTPNLKIITPDDVFNFHKFLNIGIAQAKGEYLILSNNDVLFDENWLKEVLKIAKTNKKITSFSPYDAKANKLPLDSIKKNNYILGYQIQKHLTGWCIVTHKSVFKRIKKLDDRFKFYYADNDYAMQLQKYNIKHALVTKAIAHHLESVTSKKSNSVKTPIIINKKLPKYIIKENWSWVLGNEKMMEGLILFHNKWGSRRVIKLKLKIANVLSKIGFGYLNRFIIFNN